MQISELKIPLENGLNKSPSEFEEAIRNGLTTLGIEHVTLVISSKPDFPAFKYIDGLSDGVSLTEVITDNLDDYLMLISKSRKGKIHHKLDDIMDNRILGHDKLPVAQDYLNFYSISENLLYEHGISIMFHSVDELRIDELRQLKSICDIAIAWANSWVAHRTMVSHWRKYSEPKTANTSTSLTKSELDVLDLLTKGLNGTEIAQTRDVSKETVRSQIKSILHKTQCKNQNQLISRFGQGQWLISPPIRSAYT